MEHCAADAHLLMLGSFAGTAGNSEAPLTSLATPNQDAGHQATRHLLGMESDNGKGKGGKGDDDNGKKMQVLQHSAPA
jgi:hypothetical protein